MEQVAERSDATSRIEGSCIVETWRINIYRKKKQTQVSLNPYNDKKRGPLYPYNGENIEPKALHLVMAHSVATMSRVKDPSQWLSKLITGIEDIPGMWHITSLGWRRNECQCDKTGQ